MAKTIQVVAPGVVQVTTSDEIYTMAGLKTRRNKLREMRDQVIAQQDRMFGEKLTRIQTQIDDVNELITSARELGQELP
jgi:hypothetical protein